MSSVPSPLTSPTATRTPPVKVGAYARKLNFSFCVVASKTLTSGSPPASGPVPAMAGEEGPWDSTGPADPGGVSVAVLLGRILGLPGAASPIEEGEPAPPPCAASDRLVAKTRKINPASAHSSGAVMAVTVDPAGS